MPEAPEHIHYVSQTQLSIARRYGGCKFNGREYVYDYETDTLHRSDTAEAKATEKRNGKAMRAYGEFRKHLEELHREGVNFDILRAAEALVGSLPPSLMLLKFGIGIDDGKLSLMYHRRGKASLTVLVKSPELATYFCKSGKDFADSDEFAVDNPERFVELVRWFSEQAGRD